MTKGYTCVYYIYISNGVIQLSNIKSKYEAVTSDEKLPGKVMLFEKSGKDCYTSKHWHKNLEIDFVVSGMMWVMSDNKDYDVNEGDYFVINSETVHQTCGKYPDEKVKYLVVLFSYKTITEYYPDFDKYSYDVSLSDNARVKIRDALKSIVFEIENDNEFSKLKISHAMSEILVALLTRCRKERIHKSQIVSEEFEYAKKAMDFIKENYQEKISLDDVADHVGLTPTYFSRYFKQNTGKTFKHYLGLVRLEHALSDIQEKGVSEGVAAMNNGFPSVKSFIAIFKTVYNCSPSEYSKKYHEQPAISEIQKHYN